MKKVTGFALTAAMAVSFSLAGCSSGTNSNSASAPADSGAGNASGNGGKPTELVLSTWGVNLDKIGKNVFQPFEKANNVKITIEEGNNADRLNKIRMKAHQVDVVTLSEAYAAQGAAEGLFEKIDRSKIPNINNIYPNTRAPLGEDYGPAYTVSASGLVYDSKATSTPVESYADLWRPEFKGKISLPDITVTEGPMMLDMASKVGGTSEFNADTAFAQLKKIQPGVVKYYTKSADLGNMFNQGEITIAMTQNYIFNTIKKANPNAKFVLPKEGGYAVTNTINVVKGTKNKELAEKFIDWWLSEDAQRGNALDKVDSPVNKNVKLTPEQADGLTYGEDMISKLRVLDWKTVNASNKAWIDRWNREIAGN